MKSDTALHVVPDQQPKVSVITGLNNHSSITPHVSRGKEGVLAGLVALVVMLFGYAMYRNGLLITGPFIFADEFEYFSYARDLFAGADLSNHTQYGLLYPALGSLFFNLGDVESVYHSLRILNIAILISSAIPAFLLTRRWFPNSIMLFLFPVFVATAPFSGFVYMIWAEPLYYTLFLWTAYALLCFYREPGIAVGSVGGVLLALLFHAKPGAGVVVQIAAFLSLITLVAVTPSGMRRRLFTPMLVLGICCAALTLPWMARNLSLGVGLIGYPSYSQQRASLIAEFGYIYLAKETALSVFYQLAYVFIGTWGLLGVLTVFPVMRWRTFPKENFTLIVFSVLCIAGLICLSAFGMSGYRGLGYWMPNGRYLSVVVPLLVLLSLGLLDRIPSASEKVWLILITVTLAIVTALATPLLVVAPYSFVNNTELALPIRIIDKATVVWRGRYDPSIYERIIFAVIYGATGLVLIWVSRWRNIFFFCITLVFASSFVASLAEHGYVEIIGETQAGLNDTIKFLHRQPVVEKGVAFDPELKSGNVEYITQFWTASDKLRYMDQKEVVDSRVSSPGVNFFVTYKNMPFQVTFSSYGLFVYKVNKVNVEK